MTAVVYWSGTGNTRAMAEAVAEGAGVKAVSVSEFSDDIGGYSSIAFGCPAMGDEVLEEDEFEPFFAAAEGSLAGKKLLLFGSYDWGDGEWMRKWEERARAAGAVLVGDAGIIANNAPSEDILSQCRLLGKQLSE